ncbi:MAG TPA: MaoC family dehydratase [Woeseiaceae bacterium]|nr:MaoC family dehydratase [Woeseiaceae bacterium]
MRDRDEMVSPEQYLEDFAAGQVYRGSTRITVDADAIKAFAGEFDPQPFHLDEVAARDSIFGGLAASGWHTAAMTMRLLTEGEFQVAGGLVGLGLKELKWPRPVRPGDELRVEVEILAVRESQSRPEQGLVTTRTTTLNQHDEIVQEFVNTLIVPKHRRS